MHKLGYAFGCFLGIFSFNTNTLGISILVFIFVRDRILFLRSVGFPRQLREFLVDFLLFVEGLSQQRTCSSSPSTSAIARTVP